MKLDNKDVKEIMYRGQKNEVNHQVREVGVRVKMVLMYDPISPDPI